MTVPKGAIDARSHLDFYFICLNAAERRARRALLGSGLHRLHCDLLSANADLSVTDPCGYSFRRRLY